MQKGSLLILFFITVAALAQDRAIGTWKQHLPYKYGNAVTQINDDIFCGNLHSTMFAYNRTNEEIRPFSILDNFSETEVSKLKYDSTTGTLLIAYENSNIDLLKNGKVINMPEIESKVIVGGKAINDIHFLNGKAYLACDFGIVVVDLEKEEISDTYYIGPDATRIGINAVIDDGQWLLAATEIGLMKADLNSNALFNYSN